MDVTGTSSVGLEPVDPFSATRVGNNPFAVLSNDHNGKDDDEEDDNSSGDDDIQEFHERYSFKLSSIFVA